MVKMNQMLSEKVADQILKMITVDKKFNIGDKLPNENELSSELGVSRTTLREAVKFLIAHNVLEIKRGKGRLIFILNFLGSFLKGREHRSLTDRLVLTRISVLFNFLQKVLEYFELIRDKRECGRKFTGICKTFNICPIIDESKQVS